MPERAPRMCSRCYQTAEPGSSYCAQHKNAVAVADRQRKAADPLRPLYNSQRWRRRVCQRVLSRDPQCRVLLDDGSQCPQLSRHVHHIIDAAEYVRQHGGDPDAFFDESNLACICHDCHSRITSARQRGTDSTEYALPGGDDWSPAI
jgi:hypothetical protein